MEYFVEGLEEDSLAPFFRGLTVGERGRNEYDEEGGLEKISVGGGVWRPSDDSTIGRTLPCMSST